MSTIQDLLESSDLTAILIHCFMIFIGNPFILYRCYVKINLIRNLDHNKSYNILSVYIVKWLMVVIVLNEVISVALVVYWFGVMKQFILDSWEIMS